ncbi:MAG: hypothetical protein ACLFV7_02960 [Phycisphaerae bacterium]
MDPSRATQELKVIRELMERPVRYTTQSGLAGILAGLIALMGLATDAWFSRHYPPVKAVKANLAVWSAVFVAAFLAATVCTRLREKPRNMPFWSSAKKRILMTILPPFVAGVGLTLVIVYRWWCGAGPNMWGLIPPIWMTFYGVACWQVGEFSIVELRYLGVAFILSGVAVAMLPHAGPMGPDWLCLEMPYWTLGITFGGYHIAYGLVVWARHGG